MISNYLKKYFKENENLKKENEKLKEELNHFRSGGYINHLKFEIDILRDIVDHGEILGEDQQCIDMTHRITEVLEENEELKKKLNYLRSGEYYNQLRFERDMLKDVVNSFKISKMTKENKAFINLTHNITEVLERNTILKNQQEEFINWLEKHCFNEESIEILEKYKNIIYKKNKIIYTTKK